MLENKLERLTGRYIRALPCKITLKVRRYLFYGVGKLLRRYTGSTRLDSLINGRDRRVYLLWEVIRITIFWK